MSQQIHRLEWRETGGEIGALLLEAQLIKDLQPIHNRALRRQRELCAWQLRPLADGTMQPVLAHASDVDFGAAEGLYGLFSSRRKAESTLREIAENHQLCLVLLGLETGCRPASLVLPISCGAVTAPASARSRRRCTRRGWKWRWQG